MYIDSHCHITHEREGLGSPEEIIARARAAGVEHMLNICCEIAKEKDRLIALSEAQDNIWCTIGTHPHEAGMAAEQAYTVEDIVTLAQHPKVIGIGESGLDYYYMHSSKEDQQASFRKHLQACIAADLPMITHSRDAEEDTMRLIREEGTGTKLKGLMHCFSSGPKLAEEAVDFGFYISFSGILTFKKSEELREIASRVPLDKLLIETDSPFLAPEPMRGKPNEPANVVWVCEVLAQIHDMSTQDMARVTTDNFFRVFTKAKAS